MRYLLPFLLLAACSAPQGQPGNDLGPYEFVAPGDVEPVYTWGNDRATEYADSLEEARIQDSTEKVEFAQWADSMKTIEANGQ